MDTPTPPQPDLDPVDSSFLPEPPVASPAELHTHPNGFFFGRFGLRAGYGIVIFLVVFAILAFMASIFALASTGKLHEAMTMRAFAKAHPNLPRPKLHLDFIPRFVIVNDGITFLGLFGLCWFFHKGERRPLRAYGVGSYRIADILPGAFWGLVMLGGVVEFLHLRHYLVFDGQNIHGAQILTYGFAWLIAFLCVGFSEEYTFRGYVQYTLTRGVWGLAEKISATKTRSVAFWLAACFWSAIFACAHLGNGGENFFGILQVFLAGITFAYALWRTGSLWWGIGFHMMWDWAQSFLFGVADSGNISVGRLFITHPQGKSWLSGGADGPEGSIVATIALILTILVIYFFAPPGMHPAIEQEPKPGTIPDGFHNPVA